MRYFKKNEPNYKLHRRRPKPTAAASVTSRNASITIKKRNSKNMRKCGKKSNKDRKKKKSLCQKTCCELDFPV